jgi:hypothetical protein
MALHALTQDVATLNVGVVGSVLVEDYKKQETVAERSCRLWTGRSVKMCDYSLHNVASRPARVGDKLVSTTFAGTFTRGFAALEEPGVAVCLLPGTEVAFDHNVEQRPFFRFLHRRKIGHRLARFRQIYYAAHHDALEFPDGQVVLLTDLVEGQRATVLQLPMMAQLGDTSTTEDEAVHPATHRTALLPA